MFSFLKPRITIIKWILLVGLLLSLSACTIEGTGSTGIMQQANVPVDPSLKEFYQALGGSPVLGSAISELERLDNAYNCQYTENALLCVNPSVTDSNRYFLYNLGLELDIQRDEYIDGTANSSSTRVVDGIPIYEKFIPLYDQLYGERYAGRPLTALRINPDLNRAEQFFENVGFYQRLGSPDNPVYLIPYGAYLCGGNCSSRLDEYWTIVKSSTVEQPFASAVARMGGNSVFGSLELKATYTVEGDLEQAYTNAIFYTPADSPSEIRLRPLPLILGYETQPLTTPVIHEQLVFYEVQDGLGYNVPLDFDQFIARHGGRDMSGNPIAGVINIPNTHLYRQCFENYCLVYDPAAPDMLKVRMAALGKEYLQKHPAPSELQITDLFSPQRISLVVSADSPNLGSGAEQVIRLVVQQKEDGSPLSRVESTLLLNYPDRPSVRIQLPATDDSGMSALSIPFEEGLTNGTRLWYKVCLNLPSEQPICQGDSYMIWDPGH